MVERLARRWNADWETEKNFGARLAKARPEGHRVVLCQPGTYMNASGEAIGALARFHKLPPERILVTVDDADLALGEVRLRARGSWASSPSPSPRRRERGHLPSATRR